MQLPITLRSSFSSKKHAIVPQKGFKGKGTNTKSLVNQKRGSCCLWQKTNTAGRLFQRVPLLLYCTKVSFLTRRKLFFFKSASGLLFLLRDIRLHDFGFYFYNSRSLVPSSLSTFATKQLLFTKVGTRITKLRDLFKFKVVFASAFSSTAKVMFFDRWAGFFTIRLPSGSLRFFFYLSRVESSDWGSFYSNTHPSLKSASSVNWGRAGTWSKLGRKPKVRGVAKNPVDHPHGGRTKSIRFQRTPWGLPTKLK